MTTSPLSPGNPHAYSNWESPLLHIEKCVQERAKLAGIELASTQGPEQLRAFIHESISDWEEEYQRGIRSFPIANRQSLALRAFRNLAGYGPLEPLLDDDDVWEICINAPDQIFVKRHSQPAGYHDDVFHDDEHVVRTLTRIMDDAVGAHRKFDPAEGLQDAQLKNGARMHIVHSDIGRDGHTIVNIRKFTGVSIRKLDELIERDMLSVQAASFLRAAVHAKRTIVFSGAPGSGKTTTMSCCVAELDPSLRVVIAEEVFEADVPLPNVAQMQTRPARPDRPEVDLRRLVAGFLRMAPDVAIVSEVRDREALPLLLTLSSGVTGYTTIHAGNARQALSRLRFIAQLSDSASELPLSALNALVSEAIDIVVHCERTQYGLRVMEIIAVEDLQTGIDSSSFTTTTLFSRTDAASPLKATDDYPLRIRDTLRATGYDGFDNTSVYKDCASS